MKKILKYYKCRIYPNKKQTQLFERNFKAYQFVYNESKKIYEKEYKEDKKQGKQKTYSNKYFYNILQQLIEENPQLKEIEKTILINAYRRLLLSINKYKQGLIAKPKLMEEKQSYISYEIPYNHKNKYHDKRLYLNGYGTFKLHHKQEIKGRIKDITIKKQNNQWYIILKCTAVPIEEYPKTGKKIGIDLGILNLIIMSNGTTIKPPDITKEEIKLKKLNRKLSKQKHGGQNYYKTLSKIYNVYIRRDNIIRDYLHKISTNIVKEYDFIAMETLSIEKMIQNRKYAHSIFNMNWRRLLRMIEYKAKINNKTFIQIPREYPSTKTCNKCGYINENLTIKMREWTCPKCKTHHDRDVNAAINILKKGIEIS